MTVEYTKTLFALAITMVITSIVNLFSKIPAVYKNKLNESLIKKDEAIILSAK